MEKSENEGQQGWSSHIYHGFSGKKEHLAPLKLGKYHFAHFKGGGTQNSGIGGFAIDLFDPGILGF